MPTNAHDHYVHAKVLTAAPQKLHLMLVEGAIRFAEEAMANWDRPDNAARRDVALSRSIEIVGELFSGVRASSEPVAKQFSAIYSYILRVLSEAKILTESAKLRDGLRLLEIERETWRQVCAEFGAVLENPAADDSANCAMLSNASSSVRLEGGLSIEA